MTILRGDCRQRLRELGDCAVDAVVTDPPYITHPTGGIETNDVAFDAQVWEECYRVLKPGGYMLVFGKTRGYHHLAIAIENAGFDVRDTIHWLFADGNSYAKDASKLLDTYQGHNRPRQPARSRTKQSRALPPKGFNLDGWSPQVNTPESDIAATWSGYKTAIKPGQLPILLVRKPHPERMIAENILEWGTGALNIDGCRFGPDNKEAPNVVLDADIVPLVDEQRQGGSRFFMVLRPYPSARKLGLDYDNPVPEVKPLELMRHLVRLVAPPNRPTILDPFAGSGTTLMAAVLENCNYIGIENQDDYIDVIQDRVNWAKKEHAKVNTRTLQKQ